MAESLDALAELIEQCTVRIAEGKKQGTGFFVAPGFILTCAHVVSENTASGQPVAFRWQATDHVGRLRRLFPDPCFQDQIFPDLALIEHEIPATPCVLLDPGCAIGDRLYSWGYSTLARAGESLSGYSEGARNYEDTPDRKLIKFKGTQVLPGISGSPLINRETGAVCGVVKRTRDDSSDLGGLAVRIERFLELCPDIAALNKLFHDEHTSWRAAAHGSPAVTKLDQRRSNRGPRFLDRETQENEFNTFWTDAHISRSGAPQIYLLPAMMEDCADYFTERLRDDTVERLARSFKGADRGAIDRVTIEGQPRYQSLEVLKQDFSLQLFMELGALDLWNRSDPSARLLGEHERFRLPAFVFIEHTITTDPASAILGDFFPWYFNEFWSEFKTEAKVLIFLHLEFSPLQELAPWLPRIFRRRSSGSYDRLQTQLRTALPSSEANLSPGAPGAPVKRLSPLPPIKSPDIEHWLQRLGIPRSDIKPTMQTDFGDVCRKRGPDVRFLQVQKRLETLYQRRMQVESLHGKQLQGTA